MSAIDRYMEILTAVGFTILVILMAAVALVLIVNIIKAIKEGK